MTAASFDDNLNPSLQRPVCEYNILADLGNLHFVSPVMDTPAPCGVSE